MSEREIENEIKAKGLTAARVTPEQIDAVIRGADFWRVPGTTTIVCALHLANGFVAVGHSACASPANFNEELGRKIAQDHARSQIWALEGYALRERLASGDERAP